VLLLLLAGLYVRPVLETRSEHFLILTAGQDFPLPHGQIADPKISNPNANQPQGRMANRSGHPADLPVFAFDQFHRDPTIGNTLSESNGWIARRNHCRTHRQIWTAMVIDRDGLWLQHPRPARPRPTALDENATFQVLQFLRRWNSLDLRPILPLVGANRVEKFLVQVRLITQKEKPLGIRIEPSHGPDIFRKAEVRKRTISGAVTRELGQHAKRLVKREDQGPVRVRWFPRSDIARF
jgi:hypothetical protein